jgi:glycosyltransferase involved in cell wall biosynthesis
VTGRHRGYVLKRFPRISETFVAAEIIELRRQGERITVFAVSRPDEPFTHGFLAELDVPVVYLPYRPARAPRRTAVALAAAWRQDRRGWLQAAGSALRRPGLKSWRRLLQATVLAEELRLAGVTHVHAHFASTAARLANLVWRMGGPPYSVTAHAKDIWHRDARADGLVDKLGHARFVATVSEANRTYLEALLGGRVAVHLVPNAVDLARLPAPEDRVPEPGVVLTVARLVEKKGLDALVRACGALRRSGVDARLEVVGDGPLRSRLQALAAAEGAEVTWHGALPHEQVAAHYRRAVVFALPCVVAATGDRDGLPTSVLEAMAAGVPVVTTAVNGLADVVEDGRTGLVVAERDPEALAVALKRLLADPDLAGRLAHHARLAVAEGFSLTASVTRLRSLFDRYAAR